MFVCVFMCLYVFICDHDSQSYIASSGFLQGFVVRISCCLGSRSMGRLPSGVAWWRDWAARMPQALPPFIDSAQMDSPEVFGVCFG